MLLLCFKLLNVYIEIIKTSYNCSFAKYKEFCQINTHTFIFQLIVHRCGWSHPFVVTGGCWFRGLFSLNLQTNVRQLLKPFK